MNKNATKRKQKRRADAGTHSARARSARSRMVTITSNAGLTDGGERRKSLSLGIRAGIGMTLVAAAGCAPQEESLGCAELVVECPGGASEQEWWLAKAPSSTMLLEIQEGECGEWLAFIRDGAYARYDDVDLGTRAGEMRLRVVVAAEDSVTTGGELSLFADAEVTPVATCEVKPTGGWWNWLVVDCGAMPLTGLHSLTFRFAGGEGYLFNFAAFGVVRSGSADCTVTGPKMD
jgi:hypothetical protein